MARPKLHRNSTELDAEIVRIQREADEQLQRLQDERREAEGREDRRRGEIVRACLTGARADELRRVLAACVGTKDSALFGISGMRASAGPAAPEGGRVTTDNGRIATE